MRRGRKTNVKVNDTTSLTEIMQETYNDACLQIRETQSTINELTTSTTPTDVDEFTKVAKEKGGLLKIKDSAIRIKLEIAKLQSDIIKNSGDEAGTLAQRANGSASLGDFKSIREMLKKENMVDNSEDKEDNEA